MTNRPDYYRLLHVQPDAPEAIVRASHRALMQQLKMHPDLGGDHAQAVLLNEALAVLTDPVRRAEYDSTFPSEHTATVADDDGDLPTGSASPAHATSGEALARTPRLCAFCSASAPAAHLTQPDSTCHTCGSPLYPVRRHQLTEESRRAIQRLPRSMPLTFRRPSAPAVVVSGTTEDVSLNGLRFVTRDRPTAGERLRLDCPLYSAVAIVKSVLTKSGHGATQYRVGVEFVTLRTITPRGGLVSSVA
jgi:hypothetical protein